MPKIKKDPDYESRQILIEAGFSEEVQDQILAESAKAESMDDFFGRDGIMAKFFGKRIEDLMRAELTGHLGYSKHDSNQRNIQHSDNYRNGSFPKTIHTSNGSATISVPRDRNGDFESRVLPKGERKTNELENRIISMYGRGLTNSDVKEHLIETYGVEISEAEISIITDKILPEIQEWQNRVLESTYVIVWLDCIHSPIRIEGKVEQRATYIALGLTKQGKKEILGMWVSDGAESAKYWLSVLQELKARGVQDILIACTDGLTGFNESLKAAYPKTIHQKCIIHQIRNTLKYINSKDQKQYLQDLKTVYTATTETQAKINLDKVSETWKKKYPAAAKSWYDNWTQLSAFFDFPPEIRKIMYTNNALEALNRQLRKTTKNRSVFPTQDSVLKLYYLAGKNAAKKWTTAMHNWASVLNQLTIHFEDRI
jgi:transposase-like protein